ncbi:DUF2795 domain-containing protein [Dehalogenimonas alkenigignens]|uniref:DUF2795 domain-containing protein n=1 Tax=Dehalogenimonas alkenigignens TaxID=1217799 RepID=UPI000D571819|nr:hypothetical protein DD509_06825 [Dehalogenimonas alkenigignens]
MLNSMFGQAPVIYTKSFLQKKQHRLATSKIGLTAINSSIIQHFINGLTFPANKHEVIGRAQINHAPDNVMAFFINRLPSRQFRSAADISFTVFVSSYMFGQD